MSTVTMKLSNKVAGQHVLRAPTMADLEAAFELFETCSMHMIGKPETTLAHIRSEWTSPGFDLQNSVRVVETPEGKLVGYIEVWDVDELPVSMWVWGRVHPAYEGRGIGTRLMKWAEARAREAIKRVPKETRVAMRSGTYSDYQAGHDLLRDREMNLIRHFLTMAIELNGEPVQPLWPDGIQVRPMEGEHELRKTVEAVRAAFRDHWGHVDQSFEEEYEQWLHFVQTDEQFDPSLWFLAMDGEEIAGVSLCSLRSDQDKDMGWVRTLGVRRRWRKRGLGLALLHHSFQELAHRGQKRIGLGVDASSLTGATRLYKKAGMKPIRQFDVYEKELRPGVDLTKRKL